MGGSAFSDESYRHITSRSYAGKSKTEAFTAKETVATLSPKGVAMRESRDSDVHPLAWALMLYVDVTGSMGDIPHKLLSDGKLGNLMEVLIAHGVEHAHVFSGAIGDHISDRSPIQVGQFEAGAPELIKNLADLHIEGGGGSFGEESYLLAWYFAAFHTSIDCFEKRGKKGLLITVGDEASHKTLTADYIKSIFGDAQASDMTDKELLAAAQRTFDVFHIHCADTGTGMGRPDILNYWRNLMGDNFIILQSHADLAETVATIASMLNGKELEEVASTLSADTANNVRMALMPVSHSITKASNNDVAGTGSGIKEL